MTNSRKKASFSILKRLLEDMEAIAIKNKWDVDAVAEEAFIHYLECELHRKVPYTSTMKPTIKQRATTAKNQIGMSLKTAHPLNLSKISGKKPKAGKIKLSKTKVTSTLPVKKGKAIARSYGKKIAKK